MEKAGARALHENAGEGAESEAVTICAQFSVLPAHTCASILLRKAKSRNHTVCRSSARQLPGFLRRRRYDSDRTPRVKTLGATPPNVVMRVGGVEVSYCPPLFINYVLRTTLWQSTVVVAIFCFLPLDRKVLDD